MLYNATKTLYILKKLLTTLIFALTCQIFSAETNKDNFDQESKMAWWREARFGLFIHWGLYSIPAGKWDNETTHGEWIRTSAQIPVDEYNKLINQFNPKKFNPDKWVKMAKQAGMRYIVITSKHHDGFSLFNSEYTKFDVINTPFKRDIMDEIATACRKYGLKICWYYSIMDWNHPDYLPRRNWENRPEDEAVFKRYVDYMKNQLNELMNNYGDIGVLWFDGEWEGTWNHDYGKDLYNYVRTLQPNIIVNNRVDIGRSGMAGLTRSGNYVGDFGTPEQEIPNTGFPGIDWETCMTMNNHWGYNKNDNNWKSSKDLIRKLADICSKGGNFLLNIGPTSEGLFPQESIERLEQIGDWMSENSEAIYGTTASPFQYLPWGRCTQKTINKNTRLFLHVFSWPNNGRLILPGIYNKTDRAFLLADKNKDLICFNEEDNIIIKVPPNALNPNNTVVVLDLIGKPDVNDPPVIVEKQNIFIDKLNVSITTKRENVEIYYTLDGTSPNKNSYSIFGPITIKETSLITAQNFRNEKPVSRTTQALFTKVTPYKGVKINKIKKGLYYKYFEGSWDSLPEFDKITLVKTGVLPNIDISKRDQENFFGFVFEGLILIQKKGVYSFYTDSDDGSQLLINDSLVVNNDGLHSMTEATGLIALDIGYHPIRVSYFEKTGGNLLNVSYENINLKKQPIPNNLLFHRE